MKYAAIRMAVQRTPWAILPSKFAEIYHFLLAKAEDQQPDEQRIRRALAERDARERERYAAFGVQARNGNSLPFPVVRGAAVIPILGTIIPRASLLAEMSGAISTERLRRNLRLADEDREIEEILLDIASPGGAVPGVQETYQDVKRIARRKKVTAYANHYAASAAYYIASAASELKVAPSGDVGSVGVFAAHEDWSKHLEMAGVGVEIIRSDNSPYKYEGNMFEPLPDEARAEIKRVVNVYEQQFHSDVSKGRKVPIATVREDFGMGRMRLAKEAVEAGMADAIATLEEDVLARAATRRSTVAVSRRTQHKETPMSSITEQIKEKAAAVANWLKSPTDDDEARGQVLASMKDVEAFLA
ncbi:MAG TPA: S49 family peptidase, partial [Acidobacteriota bacterium]|nr:S49 family peptidase [Acidobacteriota bacterium]